MEGQLKWANKIQGLAAQLQRQFIHEVDPILLVVLESQVAPVAGKDLVAVNEQVQLRALKSFYERWLNQIMLTTDLCITLPTKSRADQKRDLNKKRLVRCQK